MASSAIVAALHFLSIFTLGAALVSEHLFFRRGLNEREVQRLTRLDLVYGLSAIGVLVTGLLRMIVFEKGTDYYLRNPLFHTKLTLFVLIGGISIYPTLKFMNWRKRLRSDAQADLDDSTASRIKIAMRVQLTLFVIIPFLAAFVARGVGAR